MAVTIELPTEIERHLRESLGDLDRAVKEAALVELYRQGRLTQHELSLALGISRLEIEALLKRHNITEDLPTDEQVRQDAETLRRLLER